MQSMRRTFVEGKARRTLHYDQSHNEDPNTITNLRVFRMLEECMEFLPYMDIFGREVPRFARASREYFDSIHPALSAPLPRVWDHVEGGLAEPIRATVSHGFPHIAGGEIDHVGLQETVHEFDNRLAEDIMLPLGAWKQALRSVEDRIPELERMRRTAERRRQKVNRAEKRSLKYRTPMERPSITRGLGVRGLLYKMTHPRSGVNVAPVAAEPETSEEFRHEEVNMNVAHTQRKYQAARQSFDEQERMVFEQLSGLCRDASWLKSYMASVLLMTKDTCQKSTVLLGPTKQPLPGFGFDGHMGMEHGAVADNYELAASMPQFMQEWQPSKMAMAGELGRMLAATARPHKGTAQPLELHAREDVSAADMIPEVLRGASDVAATGKGMGLGAGEGMAGLGGRGLGGGGMTGMGGGEGMGMGGMGPGRKGFTGMGEVEGMGLGGMGPGGKGLGGAGMGMDSLASSRGIGAH